MFYNHAEEKEKRRHFSKTALGVSSSVTRSDDEGDGGSTGVGGGSHPEPLYRRQRSVSSPNHRRTTSADSAFTAMSSPSAAPSGAVANRDWRDARAASAGKNSTLSAPGYRRGSTGGSNDGVRMARPAWPPSHAEIVAGARSAVSEDTEIIAGPKIPAWNRGPLLLASKRDLSAGGGGGRRGSISTFIDDEELRKKRRAASAKAFQSESGVRSPISTARGASDKSRSARGVFYAQRQYSSCSVISSEEDASAYSSSELGLSRRRQSEPEATVTTVAPTVSSSTSPYRASRGGTGITVASPARSEDDISVGVAPGRRRSHRRGRQHRGAERSVELERHDDAGADYRATIADERSLTSSTKDDEKAEKGDTVHYTDQEIAVIQQVLANLQRDGAAAGRNFEGWASMTREHWARLVCLPVRKELESMDDYRAQGLDPYERFSLEGGAIHMRRWVMANHAEIAETNEARSRAPSRSTTAAAGGGEVEGARRPPPSPARSPSPPDIARDMTRSPPQPIMALKARRHTGSPMKPPVPAVRTLVAMPGVGRGRGGSSRGMRMPGQDNATTGRRRRVMSVDSSPEGTTPTTHRERLFSVPTTTVAPSVADRVAIFGGKGGRGAVVGRRGSDESSNVGSARSDGGAGQAGFAVPAGGGGGGDGRIDVDAINRNSPGIDMENVGRVVDTAHGGTVPVSSRGAGGSGGSGTVSSGGKTPTDLHGGRGRESGVGITVEHDHSDQNAPAKGGAHVADGAVSDDDDDDDYTSSLEDGSSFCSSSDYTMTSQSEISSAASTLSGYPGAPDLMNRNPPGTGSRLSSSSPFSRAPVSRRPFSGGSSSNVAVIGRPKTTGPLGAAARPSTAARLDNNYTLYRSRVGSEERSEGTRLPPESDGGKVVRQGSDVGSIAESPSHLVGVRRASGAVSLVGFSPAGSGSADGGVGDEDDGRGEYYPWLLARRDGAPAGGVQRYTGGRPTISNVDTSQMLRQMHSSSSTPREERHVSTTEASPRTSAWRCADKASASEAVPSTASSTDVAAAAAVAAVDVNNEAVGGSRIEQRGPASGDRDVFVGSHLDRAIDAVPGHDAEGSAHTTLPPQPPPPSPPPPPPPPPPVAEAAEAAEDSTDGTVTAVGSTDHTEDAVKDEREGEDDNFQPLARLMAAFSSPARWFESKTNSNGNGMGEQEGDGDRGDPRLESDEHDSDIIDVESGTVQKLSKLTGEIFGLKKHDGADGSCDGTDEIETASNPQSRPGPRPFSAAFSSSSIVTVQSTASTSTTATAAIDPTIPAHEVTANLAYAHLSNTRGGGPAISQPPQDQEEQPTLRTNSHRRAGVATSAADKPPRPQRPAGVPAASIPGHGGSNAGSSASPYKLIHNSISRGSSSWEVPPSLPRLPLANGAGEGDHGSLPAPSAAAAAVAGQKVSVEEASGFHNLTDSAYAHRTWRWGEEEDKSVVGTTDERGGGGDSGVDGVIGGKYEDESDDSIAGRDRVCTDAGMDEADSEAVGPRSVSDLADVIPEDDAGGGARGGAYSPQDDPFDFGATMMLAPADDRVRRGGQSDGHADGGTTGEVTPVVGDENELEELGEARDRRWHGVKELPPPGPVKRLRFALRDPANRYRYLQLGVWFLATILMVLDRFLWNLWPRQDTFSFDCGVDVMCQPGEHSGCFLEGPWSVKIFDVVARITGRVIISTTNLILASLCHCTWNWLSETACLHGFLRSWRSDNARLRAIGLTTVAVAIGFHLYAVLLPSIFSGFSNKMEAPTGVSWPAQVMPGEPRGDLFEMPGKVVVWTVDDLISVALFSLVLVMSAAFALRFRRYAFAVLRGNPYLVERLQTLAVGLLVVESFRRRSHPHVWILNGPILLWCTIDTLCSCLFYRVSRAVVVTRVALGSDHELLLWNRKKPSHSSVSGGDWRAGGGAGRGGSRRRLFGVGRSSSTSAAAVAPSSARPKMGEVCRVKHHRGSSTVDRKHRGPRTVVVFSPRCLAANAGGDPTQPPAPGNTTGDRHTGVLPGGGPAGSTVREGGGGNPDYRARDGDPHDHYGRDADGDSCSSETSGSIGESALEGDSCFDSDSCYGGFGGGGGGVKRGSDASGAVGAAGGRGGAGRRGGGGGGGGGGEKSDTDRRTATTERLSSQTSQAFSAVESNAGDGDGDYSDAFLKADRLHENGLLRAVDSFVIPRYSENSDGGSVRGVGGNDGTVLEDGVGGAVGATATGRSIGGAERGDSSTHISSKDPSRQKSDRKVACSFPGDDMFTSPGATRAAAAVHATPVTGSKKRNDKYPWLNQSITPTVQQEKELGRPRSYRRLRDGLPPQQKHSQRASDEALSNRAQTLPSGTGHRPPTPHRKTPLGRGGERAATTQSPAVAAAALVAASPAKETTSQQFAGYVSPAAAFSAFGRRNALSLPPKKRSTRDSGGGGFDEEDGDIAPPPSTRSTGAIGSRRKAAADGVCGRRGSISSEVSGSSGEGYETDSDGDGDEDDDSKHFTTGSIALLSGSGAGGADATGPTAPTGSAGMVSSAGAAQRLRHIRASLMSSSGGGGEGRGRLHPRSQSLSPSPTPTPCRSRSRSRSTASKRQGDREGVDGSNGRSRSTSLSRVDDGRGGRDVVAMLASASAAASLGGRSGARQIEEEEHPGVREEGEKKGGAAAARLWAAVGAETKVIVVHAPADQDAVTVTVDRRDVTAGRGYASSAGSTWGWRKGKGVVPTSSHGIGGRTDLTMTISQYIFGVESQQRRHLAEHRLPGAYPYTLPTSPSRGGGGSGGGMSGPNPRMSPGDLYTRALPQHQHQSGEAASDAEQRGLSGGFTGLPGVGLGSGGAGAAFALPGGPGPAPSGGGGIGGIGAPGFPGAEWDCMAIVSLRRPQFGKGKGGGSAAGGPAGGKGKGEGEGGGRVGAEERGVGGRKADEAGKVSSWLR